MAKLYFILVISILALAAADYKMHGMAPQGTQLLIECQFGNVSSITSAYYGANNCSNKDVKDKVQRLCLGQPVCSIRVDDESLGGDACPTHKDLIVEAVCSDCRQNTTAPMGSSKNTSEKGDPEATSGDNPIALDKGGKAESKDDPRPSLFKDSQSPSDNDKTSPKQDSKSSTDTPEQANNSSTTPANDNSKAPPIDDKSPDSPESLSLGMLQQLISMNGLNISDSDIAATFQDCDQDKDSRISGPEIQDLVGQLQKHSIPIQVRQRPGSNQSVVAKPGEPNNPIPDDGQAEKLDKLINTLCNLGDELKQLLHNNVTLPPTDVTSDNGSVPQGNDSSIPVENNDATNGPKDINKNKPRNNNSSDPKVVDEQSNGDNNVPNDANNNKPKSNNGIAPSNETDDDPKQNDDDEKRMPKEDRNRKNNDDPKEENDKDDKGKPKKDPNRKDNDDPKKKNDKDDKGKPKKDPNRKDDDEPKGEVKDDNQPKDKGDDQPENDMSQPNGKNDNQPKSKDDNQPKANDSNQPEGKDNNRPHDKDESEPKDTVNDQPKNDDNKPKEDDQGKSKDGDQPLINLTQSPHNVTDNERRKLLAFKNLMSPVISTTPPPTTPPPTTDPWAGWGLKKHLFPPQDVSTIETTMNFQVAGTPDPKKNDTFSTRSVVYIPTGQSRKLLCSGCISDVWFSTYWWPDNATSQHTRDEPDCKEEEDIALDTLKQLCLNKQDCTVTSPAMTLSDKCPIDLKYVTVAYKCSVVPQPLPST